MRTEHMLSSSALFETFLEASRQVLHETWSKEEPVVANWLFQHDDSSFETRGEYWGVYDRAKMVATARLTNHDDLQDVPAGYLARGLEQHFPAPIASMNRLAVLPDYQGLGIGRHLDELRLNRARQVGAQSVLAICRRNRISMLRKLGFDVVRGGVPGR